MSSRLQRKVALVTGASRGIGRAIAQVFAAEGAMVAVVARNEAQAQETVATIDGRRARAFTADVGDPQQVAALVEQVVAAFGRLDIVVHNAAAFSRDPLDEIADDTLQHLLDVNLKACFSLTRAALPHLRRAGHGRILVTSSITGPRVAMPATAHYAASKAGVNGFIRSAALELAGEGITVNGVEPGYIDTEAMERLKARFGVDNITRWIPMKRLGRPEDVAHAMLYLASDEAAYVTGQTIVVDGGSTLPESPIFLA